MEGVLDLRYSLEVNGLPTQPPRRSRWPLIVRSRWIPLLTCALLFGFSLGSADGDEQNKADETYNVALFTGSEKNVLFWDLFAEFMRVAGKDLGLELEVFYAEGNRNKMRSQIREVCRRSKKPDAIVVQSFKRNGPSCLKIAERNKVPIFLVNAGLTGLTDQQKAAIGKPGEKLKYWIGEMYPDDQDAGYQLANALIDEALKDPKRLGPDGRVHVIGLNGVVYDGASIERAAGLKKAIEERSDVATLDQLVPADWDQADAQFRCKVLHRRYPNASVIWCASDPMALGAIEAMRQRGKAPGTDVFIGGVDAIDRGTMDLIDAGTLSASVGGHYMDGGWVVVLLYDYFHRVDISGKGVRRLSQMTLVTKSNLDEYRPGLEKSTWETTDFRRFSHHHHPELKDYQFSLGATATASSSEKPSTGDNGENASKDDDRKIE